MTKAKPIKTAAQSMEPKVRTITRRLNSVYSDFDNAFDKKFNISYPKSRFEDLIKYLKISGSGRSSVLKELYACLDKSGIEYQKGRDNDYYISLVNSIEFPTLAEIEDKIMSLLFSSFLKKNFPSPEAYMERIVSTLENPENGWKDDPLRLRILKQFILEGRFLTYYTVEGKKVPLYGGESYIKEYVKIKTGRSVGDNKELTDLLDDGVFNDYEKFVADKKKEMEYERNLRDSFIDPIEEALSVIIKTEERIDSLLKAEKPKVDPASIDPASIINASKDILKDKLSDNIYKDINIVEYIDNKSKDDQSLSEFKEVLESLEKDIKSEYNSDAKKIKYALRDGTRPASRYGLLRLADDLATGGFRLENTRKSLYYFAIVYDMRFYTDSKDVLERSISDVSVSLFEDYYQHNLIQFSKKSFQENLSQFHMPSGRGVNTKNFAELSYLYYINKEDISAYEKIKESDIMIARLQEKYKENEAEDNKTDKVSRDTNFYRQCVYVEDILKLPQKEFEDYLVKNYTCSANVGKRNIGVISVEYAQNTAFENYKKLMSKLEEVLKELNKRFDLDIKLENLNYGLHFTDPSAFYKFKGKKISSEFPERNAEAEDFIEVLAAFNNIIGRTLKSESIDKSSSSLKKPSTFVTYRVPALFINDPNNMSRTAMIAAYYYYFNSKNELLTNYSSGKSYIYSKGFNDVFRDFQEGVNKYLEPSYYQPFSKRNIFDVLIALSSYSYLNEQILSNHK